MAISTFACAVSQGNSAGSWNMSATRRPPSSIVPALSRYSPTMRLSRVLLPQPEAPSRQANSPCETSSEKSSSATSALVPLW
jgi:hypothetical protein